MRFPPTFGRTTYFVENQTSRDLIVEVRQVTDNTKRIRVERGTTMVVDVDAIFGADPKPEDSLVQVKVLCAIARHEEAQLLWHPDFGSWEGGRIDTGTYGESEYVLRVTDDDLGDLPARPSPVPPGFSRCGDS